MAPSVITWKGSCVTSRSARAEFGGERRIYTQKSKNDLEVFFCLIFIFFLSRTKKGWGEMREREREREREMRETRKTDTRRHGEISTLHPPVCDSVPTPVNHHCTTAVGSPP